MLVTLLETFSVVFQVANGDGNCVPRFQDDVEFCDNYILEAVTEASKMIAPRAREQKLCCGFNKFTHCVTTASKKCSEAADRVKRVLDTKMTSLGVHCPDTNKVCNGGVNTSVSANTVTVYLLFSLGYFFYMNKL
uniref:U35-theraphotoxin-Cg1a n=1 Tax=Chilobrachys guangxiensis TaxID=278060 RepID=JZT73_CHIGU|nr:RecName: Full=U35-theraphotoxin-Cg1a; Short=U35-TRTX-Cg1a; AltName: Full=Jingzhaotoxin-73; Short=JZTX-73; Flags: Precursor [Chilobrachys guangxiensis]ABY71744.1 cystine knot toxin [Chilobrachys guangxiensis]